MEIARRLFGVLAWLFVVSVGIQFFLAGLGVFGGESIEAHRQMGFAVMHLIPILMFIAALVGKMGRVYIVQTVALFVLVLLQPLWVDEELDPQWLRSFHVLSAFFIAGLAQHLAQRAGWPLSSRLA